jgi:hypothetical protein
MNVSTEKPTVPPEMWSESLMRKECRELTDVRIILRSAEYHFSALSCTRLAQKHKGYKALPRSRVGICSMPAA